MAFSRRSGLMAMRGLGAWEVVATFSLIAVNGSEGASTSLSSVVDRDINLLLPNGDVRVVGGVNASAEERSSSAADIVGSFISYVLYYFV